MRNIRIVPLLPLFNQQGISRADDSNSFSLTTPAMYSAPSESAHLAEDTTTTPSDGAHLAETPQVVGDPTCRSKTWKYVLGDDRIWRKQGEGHQLQPREDNQLQPRKAKTAPTVAMHIQQWKSSRSSRYTSNSFLVQERQHRKQAQQHQRQPVAT